MSNSGSQSPEVNSERLAFGKGRSDFFIFNIRLFLGCVFFVCYFLLFLSCSVNFACFQLVSFVFMCFFSFWGLVVRFCFRGAPGDECMRIDRP